MSETETAVFARPTFLLDAHWRVAAATTAVAGIDAPLGVLFLAAWRATRAAEPVR